MALLFMEGFDGFGTTNGADISALLLNAGWPTVANGILSNDNRRGDGYCFTLPQTSTGGGVRYGIFAHKNCTEFFTGFAFKFFNGNGSMWRVYYDDLAGNSTFQFELYKNGVGGISVLGPTGDLLAYSDPNIIPGNTWHYVEIHCTGTHIVVKLNGATVIDSDGVFRAVGAPYIYNKQGMYNAWFDYWSSSTVARWDDIYVCDPTGSALNTFLEDVAVIELVITGDAGTNEMDVTGATDHYDALNDLVPDDNTSYVSTATVNKTEQFVLSDLPAYVQDVLAVSVRTRAMKDGSGYKCFVNQIVLASTTVAGATKFVSEGYAYYEDIFADKPGGTGWAIADVNALQVGFKSVVTP